MRALSLSHGSRSDRIFALALAFLGFVAAAQVLCALLIFWQHAREQRRIEAVPSMHAATIAASGSVAAAASPSARGWRHFANSVGRAAATPPPTVAEQLLQVARALRKKGDTGDAIAKLQQAATLAPQNADVLAELALTYESMQLFDRSNETWRRLKSLGAAAGPLEELADLKLRTGVPVAGIPGSTGKMLSNEALPNDSAAIPDGSVFGISQVTQSVVDDPDAVTHLKLRVGVKRRPGAAIDYTKVKIQVFFYDVVDNDQVELTDADVSYEWVTPGHNWTNTDTEVLDVTYIRHKKSYPAPGTMLAPVPESVEKAKRAAKKSGDAGADLLPSSENNNRQYLGYIVRVYYRDELQAVRADPTRLLNLFPPPFTAPPQ
jgi:tetratricopeptide (TPR) repeat protein